MALIPKSNERLNSSSCSSNNSKNSSSAQHIKTEAGVDQTSPSASPFKLKKDEDHQLVTSGGKSHPARKSAPVSKSNSILNKEHDHNSNTNITNESTENVCAAVTQEHTHPLNMEKYHLEKESDNASQREFFNQLYTQILSSSQNPPAMSTSTSLNASATYMNSDFLRQIQHTLFKSNFQHASNQNTFGIDTMTTNNTSGYLNSRITEMISPPNTLGQLPSTSKNKESKLCNGKFNAFLG